MESNTENICTDYLGNPLAVGDEVVVLSSGNSSWRKGIVTRLGNPGSFYDDKIQVEYHDHWYCDVAHYELKSKPFKFKTKGVKVSVSKWNIVKLLPEYLED